MENTKKAMQKYTFKSSFTELEDFSGFCAF